MTGNANLSSDVIEVRDLSIGYGKRTVMEHLDFSIRRGEIFGLLGGSGCGKSTLMKHLIGLYRPQKGDIRIFGESIVAAPPERRREMMRRFGVTYQGGALFGSLTLSENVALPLQEFTDYPPEKIDRIVREKLALVDLADFGNYMPAEISGGMKKRAGLARALALDPELLFFDEPSAGLDPLASAALDRLIRSLRDKLGATVVIVTHELDSIFSIADRVIMLDKSVKTAAAIGDPRELKEHSGNAWVKSFLNRDGLKGA
ncbi:MAG: ATP-binding cassette domain-containing protein [Victivallaceae bacterium]|nr:ATP-binding cassette domain-containing protein [Victivallaceae bacterium]